MCQIIAIRTTVDKFKKLIKDRLYLNMINNILEDKGGDYYTLSASINESNLIISNSLSIIPPLKELDNIIDNISNINTDQKLNLLLFSRQQPEMEEATVEEQPYLHNQEGGMFFAVHGTIHNDKELAKNWGIQINADTEILKYLHPSNWDKAKGTYCVLGIKDNDIFEYKHGLEIWTNKIIIDNEFIGDIFSTNNLSIFDSYINTFNTYDDKRILSVSFSGGMDIALSTYRELKSGNYKSVILNYFAWGSIAEPQEIASLEKFKDFYSSEFDIPVEIEIWAAGKYFNEYFAMNNAPIPKISKNHPSNLGEVAETESPLAYVPYRNTQFAVLLASKAEALELKNVNILFGLNLSEGMVYMDNSEGWLNAINSTIIYGGKDYELSGTYAVISPYFTKTKTNMLKEFIDSYGMTTLEQLLLLSKSCYYPKTDGSPCGKCGSCILRQKAIESIKEK